MIPQPLLFKDNLSKWKKRSEKEWCFEDIIKDIVQRTTFCIFELLLSLKTTQNMEIWLPEAHKSMISKASEPNKYGELNTLKCKSHLKICIWVNLKEVCFLKNLWGRNGWSWRGFVRWWWFSGKGTTQTGSSDPPLFYFFKKIFLVVIGQVVGSLQMIAAEVGWQTRLHLFCGSRKCLKWSE